MPGDMNFTFDKGDKAKAARSPRRRTAFLGRFESVSARGPVAVRNLSCTGAMIEGDELPAAGRDIVLKAQGMELFGKVAWSKGRRCGLEFDTPLSQAQVIELHRITADQIPSEPADPAEWRFRLRYRDAF